MTGSLLKRQKVDRQADEEYHQNPLSQRVAGEGLRGLWEVLKVDIPEIVVNGSHSVFPPVAFQVFDLIHGIGRKEPGFP